MTDHETPEQRPQRLIDVQAWVQAQELARPRKTLPEALDAAQTGEEFGQVLQGLFASLERAKDEEEGK